MSNAPNPVPLPVTPGTGERKLRSTADSDADRHLLRQFLSGSDEGFTAFYRRFAPGLFSMIFQILQDQKESEDVLQESFVQMWKKTSTYDSTRSSLFTWAVMISRNRAIDRLRSRQRKARTIEAFTVETFVSSTSDGPQPGDESLSAADDRLRLRSALSTLPVPQREAIELAFLSGMTQAEISEKLSAPLGTIKARIRRGLIAMRDLLHRTP